MKDDDSELAIRIAEFVKGDAKKLDILNEVAAIAFDEIPTSTIRIDGVATFASRERLFFSKRKASREMNDRRIQAYTIALKEVLKAVRGSKDLSGKVAQKLVQLLDAPGETSGSARSEAIILILTSQGLILEEIVRLREEARVAAKAATESQNEKSKWNAKLTEAAHFIIHEYQEDEKKLAADRKYKDRRHASDHFYDTHIFTMYNNVTKDSLYENVKTALKK